MRIVTLVESKMCIYTQCCPVEIERLVDEWTRCGRMDDTRQSPRGLTFYLRGR